MTSDEVMTEYTMPTMEAMGGVWTENHSAYVMRRMADEIVKLRSLLRALREPCRSLFEAGQKRVEIFDQIDAALDAVREWHREDIARLNAEDA